jgi:hypothetical protein
MASPPENRPPFSDPADAGRSESYAGSPDPPAPSEDLHQQLEHWDELSQEDLARFESNPEAQAKLQRLRDAQSWLEDSLLTQQECPQAEELFALAMPFSGESLDETRRVEIQEHLKLCADCAQDIQTLERRPPAPLLVDNPDRFEVPPPNIVRGEAPAPLRRMRSIVIGAAALMLLWLFGGRELFSSFSQVDAASGAWPETTTLRGDGSSVLLTPRGKLLARDGAETWKGSFAWIPKEDAQGYRVTLLENDGSAFDPGREVHSETIADASFDLAEPLSAGHYTVEIFVTIFGLETPLGSAEFQVVAAPKELAELESLVGPDRVTFLHHAGWLSDALLEARNLPEGPERESYIKVMEAR